MASNFKVRVSWRQGSLSASELYYTPAIELGNQTVANTWAKHITDLLNARSRMMFENQQITSVGIASEQDTRLSWILRPGSRPWPTRTSAVVQIPSTGNISITASRRPEQIRVAVIMELTFGGGLRNSRRFISSVPDDVTNYDDQTVLYDKVPQWWKAFEGFRSELVKNSWSVKGKSYIGDAEPIEVAKVVVQSAAPSLVGVQVPTGAAPSEWESGTVIDLAGFTMRDCPCPTINGRWTIDSRNDTLTPGFTIFYLADSANVDVTKVKTLGTAQLVAFDYLPIEDAIITTASIHQRGNGSRRRGRSNRTCCPR